MWLYLHNMWGEVSISGCNQTAYCWGLPGVSLFFTQWPRGKHSGEWWNFSHPLGHPVLGSSIMVGGKRGSNGCILPLSQIAGVRPSSVLLGCGSPCPCMSSLPREHQSHETVAPYHPPMGRASCWREDNKVHRREDDLHPVNWKP